MSSPFHAGEQRIQARLGVRDKLEDIGRRVIRPLMPEQHRTFFAQQPWLLSASVAADGWPHASLLHGTPGFASSPEPATLKIDALPEADDPLAEHLQLGAPLGLLGLEMPTRRRNRLNGRVSHIDSGGFSLAVSQSFGNCPKYIQARDWRAQPRRPGPCERGQGLDRRWLELARCADTLFIASYNADPHSGGADISHRGGAPGFLALGNDGRLWLPDYSGNLMFNSLGNLLLEPRCCLLLIDFASGDLLHLQARAELYWPEQLAARGQPLAVGAERMLALTPGAWLLRRARLPLAFGPAQASPFLPTQGS
ncbi:pyridoxamine 5'-phosphate oxidase family protein [Pseudomonas zhanjiangensis]|uniref:Pyridoxamine 5'-phosphate oxidase family protein n=1 Tax=Pseudomonas zhanjiangensis TaxID=3239015 RepID=A0ABV3YT40_9PSED